MGLFTTAAADNIDYTLVLQQQKIHFMTRDVVVINQTTSNRSAAPLPLKYTNVPPAASKTKEFIAPDVHGPVKN